MDERYNSLAICRANYKTDADMWDAIAKIIRILMEQNYICEVYCDEHGLGIYVINYNYRDESMSGVRLEWLTEHEYVETEKYID